MALVLHASALSTTAAIVTILLGVTGLFGLLYRAIRRLEGAVGTDKFGRTLNERMDRVEHQLWPNGGSSLADRTHQTADSVRELRAESRVVRDLLAKILETR